MPIKIKVCCPMCDQLKNLAELSQHIEFNHIIAGPGSHDDLFEGELILNLNPDRPYYYGEDKAYLKEKIDFASQPVRKMKPCPGSQPFG